MMAFLTEIHLYIAGVMILFGSVFCLLATVGIVRLPDLFTRIHAASKAGLLGAGLLFAAIAVVNLDSSVTLRAIAGFGFLMLTTPVGAHLLSRAAYQAGYKPDPSTVMDDMADRDRT